MAGDGMAEGCMVDDRMAEDNRTCEVSAKRKKTKKEINREFIYCACAAVVTSHAKHDPKPTRQNHDCCQADLSPTR